MLACQLAKQSELVQTGRAARQRAKNAEWLTVVRPGRRSEKNFDRAKPIARQKQQWGLRWCEAGTVSTWPYTVSQRQKSIPNSKLMSIRNGTAKLLTLVSPTRWVRVKGAERLKPMVFAWLK